MVVIMFFALSLHRSAVTKTTVSQWIHIVREWLASMFVAPRNACEGATEWILNPSSKEGSSD